MASIKRKAVVLEGERTEKGILAFPRFFIKSVSGHFSIYHRLTHSYMTSVNSEDEAVEYLGELASLTEEELWGRLLRTRGFSIANVMGTMRSKHFETEEDWYEGAWGIYTTHFYEKYPQLFREAKDIPKDIINTIRQQIASEQLREHERHVAEIEAKEEEYRTGKVVFPKVPKVEPKPEPKSAPPVKEEITPPPIKKKKVIKKVPKIKMPTVKRNIFE